MTPGAAITHLVMAVAVMRNGGVPVAPRVTADGTRVPLPARPLAGRGELVVTVRDERTCVRIDGVAPPWPFSMGWERRCLARLLSSRIVFFQDRPPA